MAIEIIEKNGVEKYADESINNLFAPESFATMKDEIAGVREMILNTTKESISQTFLALSGRKETCSKLPKIKVPVLIMVGREDIITPPDEANLMHEKIKGSFLHIIGHAGHLSNLENPYDFNEKIRKFIDPIFIHQLFKRYRN